MRSIIIRFLNTVKSFLSVRIMVDWVFFTALAAITAVFIVAFILSFAVKKIGAASKTWFKYLSYSLCLITFSALMLSGETFYRESLFLTSLVYALSSVYRGVLYFQKTKIADSSDAKELIRVLDSQPIEKVAPPAEKKGTYDLFPIKEIEKSVKEEKPVKEEISLSHVREIMDRLSLYSLTVADKTRLEKIKLEISALSAAQSSPNFKEKISDNVTELFKIMSKYA